MLFTWSGVFSHEFSYITRVSSTWWATRILSQPTYSLNINYYVLWVSCFYPLLHLLVLWLSQSEVFRSVLLWRFSAIRERNVHRLQFMRLRAVWQLYCRIIYNWILLLFRNLSLFCQLRYFTSIISSILENRLTKTWVWHRSRWMNWNQGTFWGLGG